MASLDDRASHRLQSCSHDQPHRDPHVDSRYALVIMAAKRARQINSYHHQLGEGIGFEEAPPPLIESRSKNYLTMAMEEIAQGKIAYALPGSTARVQRQPRPVTPPR